MTFDDYNANEGLDPEDVERFGPPPRVLWAGADRRASDMEGGEYWTYAWVVEGPCTDEMALWAAGNPCAHSGGPGQAFAFAPVIKRNASGSRVIVRQCGGLNI